MDDQLGSGLSNLWSCTSLGAGLDFLKKREMSSAPMVKKEVESSCLDDEIRVACWHYIYKLHDTLNIL